MSASSSISGKGLTRLALSTRDYFLGINHHQLPLKAAHRWLKTPIAIKVNQFYDKPKATEVFFTSSLQAMSVRARAQIYTEKHHWIRSHLGSSLGRSLRSRGKRSSRPALQGLRWLLWLSNQADILNETMAEKLPGCHPASTPAV